MWKYDAASNPQPVKFTHGSHTLEVVWTILPAATLLFIAIYQMNAWADAKMRSPTWPDGMPARPTTCRRPSKSPAGSSNGGCAIAGQRRPARHARTTSVHVNDLHVPVDEEIARSTQEPGRAAQLLPAEPAGQAGRRARA